MCLNSHIVICFLCPLTHYMYSINIYGDTCGSHFYPCLSVCLFYLISLLIIICWFPHNYFTVFYFIFWEIFKRYFWWHYTDSLGVPVPFGNLSAEWWWYQILLTVLGPTHDLFHLWINTCSVKSEQTNNEKYLWEYKHQFFMSLMDLFYFPKISISNDQLAKFHTDLLKPYNCISQGNKK